MMATLVEIDHACPPQYWYARYAGQRLWCRPAREAPVSSCWVVVPGQGVTEHPDNVIFPEHAWQVRDGEVETVLIEIEPRSRQMEARL